MLSVVLLALVIGVVVRNSRGNVEHAEQYLKTREVVRAIKLESGIPLSAIDFAARRAKKFD